MYKGPVTLIRKTDDILMRSEIDEVSTNRANFLLLELIKKRYGSVFTSEESLESVRIWLGVEEDVRCEIEKQLDKEKCSNHLENFDSSLLEGLSDSFKQEIAVFLASQFMKNQKGPHSSVLNFDYIQPPAHVPWND